MPLLLVVTSSMLVVVGAGALLACALGWLLARSHSTPHGNKQQRQPDARTRPLAVTLGVEVGNGQLVALLDQDVRRHITILGVTGVGKSRSLASTALQLMNQGVGVCLLDPHGDTVDLMLGTLLDQGYFAAGEAALRRVVYLDCGRRDRFMPYGVLNLPYPPRQTASLFLEAWRRAWPGLNDGSAPLLEQTVLSSAYLLAATGEPVAQMERLLTESAYRNALLRRLMAMTGERDGDIHAFFRTLDATGRGGLHMTASARRRAFLMTYHDALKYSLGQRENALDFRRYIDSGVSLLINLAGMEPEAQRFLGCLLTVHAEQAALSRVDTPASARRPYFLMLDEAGSFTARSEEALERILAQTRKFSVYCTLAYQTLSQVGVKLTGALQNTTLASFRVGADDASQVASRIARVDPYRVKHVSPRGYPSFMSLSEQRQEWSQLVQSLPPQQLLLRLGEETRLVQTVRVPEPRTSASQVQAIKERYAALYQTPRAEIEARWSAPSGSWDKPSQDTPTRMRKPQPADDVIAERPRPQPGRRVRRATPLRNGQEDRS